MNINHFAYNKKFWTTFTIVLFICLSWLGNIDKLADEYTHDSILQAGTAYAAARGINAVVSVLQTSTIEFSFFAGGSIGVGELLDPVNDLIEKFSHVMVVAFGSLVLQKILLVLTAHGIFSFAITVLGITLIILIHVGKAGALQAVMRLFILFVFVRFSMGIVVSLNSVVDRVFLDSQIVTGSENLNTFHLNLKTLNKKEQAKAKEIEMLNMSIRDNEGKIAHLEGEVIPKLKSKLEEAEGKVADSKALLQNLDKDNRWGMLGLNEKQDVKAAKELVSSHEDARDEVLNNISEKESEVEDLIDDIDSKREDLADESEGYFDAIRDAVSSISNITERVGAAVDNIIELLVLFVLKAVLIPLLFFYGLIKVARWIWDANLEDIFVGDNQVTVSNA